MRFSRERGRCHLPQSTANLCLHAAHKVSSETCFSYIMESERLRDYRPYGQRFNGKWDSMKCSIGQVAGHGFDLFTPLFPNVPVSGFQVLHEPRRLKGGPLSQIGAQRLP